MLFIHAWLHCYVADFNSLMAVDILLHVGMGYLSTRDFQRASINWIAQFINIAGQALLYTGVNILHRAGLEKF